MPQYILHIGPHKTGSSYLQVLFRKLSANLRARGIVYPRQWEPDFAPGHVLLARRLKDPNDAGLAAEFAELNQSDAQIVLISAEDIAALSLEQLVKLKEYIGDHPIKIIYYCRRWIELLPSAWQELVKHGSTLLFPEFSALHFMNPPNSHTINYALTLDKFEHVFSFENIVLVSYSNIRDKNGDIAQHFFSAFLKWPNPPIEIGPMINASLTIYDIEMIRALNVVQKMDGAPEGPAIRVKYLNAQANLPMDPLITAMVSHKKSVRFNENAPALHKLHMQIFEKFGRNLVAPGSGRYFFLQRQGDIEYISPNYLLEPGVVALIRAVSAGLNA